MGLKNISQAELDEILKQHYVWLKSDGSKGYQADLIYTDLSGINLRGTNLRDADLWGANLQEADLQGANLQEADLEYADLQGANLQEADLEYADLHGVNLHGADLRDTELHGADLHGADLWGANLQHAELQGANLEGANLQGTDLKKAGLQNANLHGANLQYTDLQYARLEYTNLDTAKMDDTTKGINGWCPKTGSFVGYKKSVNIDHEPLLVTLEIPEDAERSSATGKKCRCSKAKVISIEDSDTGKHQEVAYGVYDDSFEYQVGKTVVPDEWDSQFWKEFTHGIHFFMNKQDALDY